MQKAYAVNNIKVDIFNFDQLKLEKKILRTLDNLNFFA